jgi:hypothetical protein
MIALRIVSQIVATVLPARLWQTNTAQRWSRL